MSQFIKDQIVLDEANEVKLLQEHLSDGSKVYNVLVDHVVMFYCDDYKEAAKLFSILVNTNHAKIH
jgi:hypothetical protein